MAERDRSSFLLILAYVPILSLIPLLAKQSSREVRWHAKNGLLLFGVVVVIGIVLTLLGILIPSVGCLYGLGMFLVAFAYAIIVILAVVKALQGERLFVPGISTYVERF